MERNQIVNRLYLLRHAKAGMAAPSTSDFDRPLDATGRNDASEIGRIMQARGLMPEQTLCSAAKRTRETLTCVSAACDVGQVDFLDILYSGDTGAYIGAIARQGAAKSLLVVGHNPMIDTVAQLLVGSGDAEAKRRLAPGFPTSGLAVIDFAEPFDGIAAGTGSIALFLKPGDE